MENAGAMQDAMMGWGGVWHWLTSFQGILTLFFVAVIVFALLALLRDWRRDRDESATGSRSGTTGRNVGSSG
ncbi:MAG: hypothetical protein IPM60_16945 [Rhodospirillales bacterium]|nr:hypothetical protein [Rhodospirillales bacterium]